MEGDAKQSTYRKIIHIDMDAFYASVEQRDFPEYRGKPLVVGGQPNNRGVVATASYEARKYGVRSAMSCSQAAQLCPGAIFVSPRFDIYKEVSAHIRSIFRRYTDIIEPLSLDEAFLDVTVDKLGIGSAIDIAKQIKQAINTELNLTASAGVSINKFVAKIASDMQKPDGLTFIGPSKVAVFMERLSIEKFFGVGKVTAAKMRRHQIHTGADLKQLSEAELVRLFGKSGRFYYQVVRGIDNRAVQPHRRVKSLAVEDTFHKDISNLEEMAVELKVIAGKLVARMEKKQLKPKTMTLKIKFADFRQITRSYTSMTPVYDVDTILDSILILLHQAMEKEERPVRLLGISVSNFMSSHPDIDPQLTLF